MHELALCQSIFEIADRARDGGRVEVIHLRVGRLRQVVPETLVYCWGLLSETTDLDGSRLHIDPVPVTLRCSCGNDTVVGDSMVLVCSRCESGRVDVVSGEEFVLTSLELAEWAEDTTAEVGHG